jgi:Kef-type K+ transport system membrane component KefB
MIYLAALLAELAGVEAIIGAFFAGLALNRLIPHTSSLMNRVEFVGNAILSLFPDQCRNAD